MATYGHTRIQRLLASQLSGVRGRSNVKPAVDLLTIVVLITQHNYGPKELLTQMSGVRNESEGKALVSKSSGMRGGRSRNDNGRLRQVRSDKHLSTVRDQYGKKVALGRGDTHLGTVRKRTGKSETKLVRDSK